MARPRSFDADRVLDGAVAAFREDGFEGTSVPALVERLGICRQSLYSTFGSKRELYLRALERYAEVEIDAKVALLEAPGSALENLRTIIRGWSDMATRCPHDGCLTAKAIAEVGDDEEAVRALESHVDRLEGGFRAALERAQVEGELKECARPAPLAQALVTTCYGIGTLSRLPGSGPRIAASVGALLTMLEAVTASADGS